MNHWTAEQGLQPVHRDAFGGAVYLITFDGHNVDEGADLAADIEAQEDTADAKELANAMAASTAHVVIHSNGHEEWTTSGIAFAMAILERRAAINKAHTLDLFAAA